MILNLAQLKHFFFLQTLSSHTLIVIYAIYFHSVNKLYLTLQACLG